MTNRPLLSRILATFRSPEFGFLGFTIPTRRHTPFISGRSIIAGEVGFRALCSLRQPRRTWLYVALWVGVLVKDRRSTEGCVRFVVERARFWKVDASRSIEDMLFDAIVVCMVLWLMGRADRFH